MRTRPLLIGALALGACLRASRIPARWDEVSWLYAAYYAPTVDALRAGDWGSALGFVGLHPPLYSLLHAAVELIWPAPVVWLTLSAICSLGAVAWVSRAGRSPAEGALAAWVLALGPVQLAYAAEVNNYPLTVMVIAAVMAGRQRVLDGGGVGLLALAGAAACWTHGLAGWVAGLCALSCGRRGLPALVAMALACAPLAPEILALVGDDNTYKQPPVLPGAMLWEYGARFGWLGLALLPFGAVGARRRPALGAIWAATAALIVGLQVSHIAAPHQYPYHLALGALGAPLVAAGVGITRARSGAAVVGVVALLQGLSMGALDARGFIDARRTPDRAMAAALAAAGPEDAIYLVAPSWTDDDDKRLTSKPLRRLSMWAPLPAVTPYDFDYADFRHGQPRRSGDTTLYVVDWPRREVLQAAAAHERLFVVVDQPRDDLRYTSELAARLGVEPVVYEQQLLFVVE